MEPHGATVCFRLYLIAARSAFASQDVWFEAIERVVVAAAQQAPLAALQVRIEPEFAREAGSLASSVLRRIRETDPDHQLPLFLNAPGVDAAQLGYDGAHWREDEIPANPDGASAGPEQMRSASAHSIDAVRRAEHAGADLVLFGPVWHSLWKGSRPLGLEALREAARGARIPVFALGGVTPERAAECLEHGAHGVALVGGVLHAADPGVALAQYASAIADVLVKLQSAGDA
jgi:thiamine-phosphate diphosphorylase